MDDESGYANLLKNSPEILGIEETRTEMGNIGAPYDTYMVEDASKIIKNYKAAVFPCPIPSDAAKSAISMCEKMNIPYLSAGIGHPKLSTEEIREFVKACGVHLYTECGEVIYAGGGYIALHSDISGRKTIALPKSAKISSVIAGEHDVKAARVISFDLEQNNTVIYRIKKDR